MAYTTVPAVKLYLGISEATDDVLLGSLVDAAQKQIESFTGRVFEADVDTTRYYDAIGDHIRNGYLFVNADLCAVTTVTNGDGVEIASDEYTFHPRNDLPIRAIRILSNSGKYWDYNDEYMDAISITGRWAYSTEAPEDIVRSTTRLSAFLYRQKDAQMFDVTAIEGSAVITPIAIPADIRGTLMHYRRIV